MLRNTVPNWAQRFSSGRESLKDDPRVGRPITVVTQQNIATVKCLVADDPHISIDYIADVLDISCESIDTILKHRLKLRKMSSSWVPHKLTQQQR
ncbi:unnamed protein product [Adineta ricciae]|uniref:Transposase n=1 Tax=Adineta ricciae TaxID=249248 RepID=A0A814UUK4_ADIRI|nr:unnamed protein product [Adineta ricciae]CAF1179481.1 unnamed protein product [Adineta ricciae]